MNGWMNDRMNEWMNKRMEKQMMEWTKNEQTNEWMILHPFQSDLYRDFTQPQPLASWNLFTNHILWDVTCICIGMISYKVCEICMYVCMCNLYFHSMIGRETIEWHFGRPRVQIQYYMAQAFLMRSLHDDMKWVIWAAFYSFIYLYVCYDRPETLLKQIIPCHIFSVSVLIHPMSYWLWWNSQYYSNNCCLGQLYHYH